MSPVDSQARSSIVKVIGQAYSNMLRRGIIALQTTPALNSSLFVKFSFCTSTFKYFKTGFVVYDE